MKGGIILDNKKVSFNSPEEVFASAKSGNVYGQYTLGLMYLSGKDRNGQGVAKNSAEAVKWFYKAAKQGHAEAQYFLGLMYYDGDGVKENDIEAAKWYNVSAKQGYADAQFNLGKMYYFGRGVKQSFKEAINLFYKAAKQGHIESQFHLAQAYAKGEGVTQNYTEAAKWYYQAANKGYAPAQTILGLLYEEGQGVPKNISEAQKWMQMAVAQGDEEAKRQLARMRSQQTATKSGCYIATAVYGSYDCPQVWTLRRYRDNTLFGSWYGRAFVRTYYAVSPTVVKLFGKTNWLNRLWRNKLDKMVDKLNASGVEDTPYND